MKNVYVVFLASNYKTSAFIRKFTRYKFSHVAISETPTLDKMYSFARKYQNTPFVGGFVIELPSRYFISEKKVPVKVCAIPLEDSEYDKVMARIASFKQTPDQYKYNYFSALAYWFKKPFKKKDAFICIEFVLYALGIDKFMTIKELEKRLCDNVVFEGTMDEIVDEKAKNEKSGDYFEKKSVWFTVKNFSKDIATLITAPVEK
ncbi:MAG: hypothetical protein E7647_05745 [Ruminococcaceae bacterium]|nr:hypothetical protein [Oscillospiraceae bacterium]